MTFRAFQVFPINADVILRLDQSAAMWTYGVGGRLDPLQVGVGDGAAFISQGRNGWNDAVPSKSCCFQAGARLDYAYLREIAS